MRRRTAKAIHHSNTPNSRASQLSFIQASGSDPNSSLVGMFFLQNQSQGEVGDNDCYCSSMRPKKKRSWSRTGLGNISEGQSSDVTILSFHPKKAIIVEVMCQSPTWSVVKGLC